MICLHFEKTLKDHHYGYLMKGLGLGSKNMLFVFRFSCFFRFRKHKKTILVHLEKTLKNGKMASIWVSNERSRRLGSKNMYFVFRFLCLFTFVNIIILVRICCLFLRYNGAEKHKQLPMVARFFKGYASLESFPFVVLLSPWSFFIEYMFYFHSIYQLTFCGGGNSKW
jgi:hypothetical protein